MSIPTPPAQILDREPAKYWTAYWTDDADYQRASLRRAELEDRAIVRGMDAGRTAADMFARVAASRDYDLELARVEDTAISAHVRRYGSEAPAQVRSEHHYQWLMRRDIAARRHRDGQLTPSTSVCRSYGAEHVYITLPEHDAVVDARALIMAVHRGDAEVTAWWSASQDDLRPLIAPYAEVLTLIAAPGQVIRFARRGERVPGE